jgi:hypothetical protein
LCRGKSSAVRAQLPKWDFFKGISLALYA